MMKTLFMCCFFMTANVLECYTQTIDTVYIEFDNNLDRIIMSEDRINYIWLKNLLYDEELNSYNIFIREYKKDTSPPPIFSAFIPVEYYKFFITDEIENCCQSITAKIIRKEINMFKRKDLKNLTPYGKKIYVIKEEDDSYICYPVSFYHNTQE